MDAARRADGCARRLGAQTLWRSVRAMIAAAEEEYETAVRLAEQALELAETTDNLNRRAAVHRNLGEVLRRAGRQDEAIHALEQATELYEQKGNAVGALRANHLKAALVLA